MPKYSEYDDTMHPLSAHAEASLATRIENINRTNITTNDVSASTAAQAHAGAITASAGAESTIANTNTDWINNKYRPAMGWTYMIICIFDFIIAPIMWSIVQAIGNGGVVSTQWAPLSLGGGGLLHVAFGAVIGISAFGRTKEKLAAKD